MAMTTSLDPVTWNLVTVTGASKLKLCFPPRPQQPFHEIMLPAALAAQEEPLSCLVFETFSASFRERNFSVHRAYGL